MFNTGRVGVVIVLAVVGCGGTALESGSNAGDSNAGGGNAPATSRPYPEPVVQAGAPSAVMIGDPGPYVDPGYGGVGGAPSDETPAVAGGYGPSYAGGGFGPSYAGGGFGPSYAGGGFGGVSGAGDSGGAFGGVSGIDGANSDCSSSLSGPPLAPWQPETPPDEPVGQLFADARAKLSGNWRGVVTSQFVNPYAIVVSFHSDGSYSAHCTEHSADYDGSSGGCCLALYYGTDRDSALKRWAITTADANGTTSGDLDVVFAYGDSFGESGYQGRITNLQFDAADLRAQFTFVYGDRVVGLFDLERTP